MNSNLLTELAARINEAYEVVASAQKGTLECAIKTGELRATARMGYPTGAQPRSYRVLKFTATPSNIAQAVVGHRPPGIVGVYEVHQYADEKREALELWALAKITNPVPAPAKVVKLARRRR